ncbi:hypothetical protein DFS33DRAFT_1386650 [Desarmillaria ectypa]|nr:hypothetical protein DFS33DRAFT_1386650 [Desarmillaria ectypa]
MSLGIQQPHDCRVTKISRFSYGPFHAALGILMTRMRLDLHKAASPSVVLSRTGCGVPARQEGTLPWKFASLPSLSFESTTDSHPTQISQPRTHEMRDIVLEERMASDLTLQGSTRI